MLRRKSKGERDLAALAGKVEEARANLAVRREAEQAAEAEHRATLDSLAADLGLGEIDEAEYERRKAKADETLTRARYERERAEAVVRVLSARAADLADEVGRAKVEAAEADERRAIDARDEAASILAQADGKLALAQERLAFARRQARDARAPFDADAAAEAERLAAKDAHKVAWYVQERYAPDDPRISEPWLRDAVAAEIERRKAEDAAYQARLKSRPDYVGPVRDDRHGLGEGDQFPILRAPR